MSFAKFTNWVIDRKTNNIFFSIMGHAHVANQPSSWTWEDKSAEGLAKIWSMDKGVIGLEGEGNRTEILISRLEL